MAIDVFNTLALLYDDLVLIIVWVLHSLSLSLKVGPLCILLAKGLTRRTLTCTQGASEVLGEPVNKSLAAPDLVTYSFEGHRFVPLKAFWTYQ